MAFACGERTGVVTTRMPPLAEHLVEGAAVLAVAVADQEAHAARSMPRLRACWVTQAPVGLGEQPASHTRRFAHDCRKRAGRLGLGGNNLVIDRARSELDAIPRQPSGGHQLDEPRQRQLAQLRHRSVPRRARGRSRARQPRRYGQVTAWRHR
jgi:hypothetical protein